MRLTIAKIAVSMGEILDDLIDTEQAHVSSDGERLVLEVAGERIASRPFAWDDLCALPFRVPIRLRYEVIRQNPSDYMEDLNRMLQHFLQLEPEHRPMWLYHTGE